jgi:peptidyl-prolyl cis-trans isomerase B (cyclophilin B)
MIQGGGFTKDLQRKPTEQAIANEAFNGLKNERGSIAMARTNAPHSATAQFFINTVNNKMLNHTSKTSRGRGYAVFGKVTKGMDIVDKIESAKTGARGMFPSDVPQQDIIIQKVEIISE